MFEYAYDLSGCTYPVMKEYPIDAATVLKKGEAVKLSNGKVVGLGAVAATDALLGVISADHAAGGATSVKVYCGPYAVYKWKAAAGATLPKAGAKGITFKANAGNAGLDLDLAGATGTAIQVVQTDNLNNVYVKFESQFK